MRNGERGFTLLELLVVVIIIGILATVALPQFGKAIDRAREAEAQNILSAVLNAELAYYQENNIFTNDIGKLLVTIPPMKDWDPPTAGTVSAAQANFTLTGGLHGHGTTHKLEGRITDTGSKTVTITRP